MDFLKPEREERVELTSTYADYLDIHIWTRASSGSPAADKPAVKILISRACNLDLAAEA